MRDKYLRYEAIGLSYEQARAIADDLCGGTAMFGDGHAWPSATCVVRPEGCQCEHCKDLEQNR